MAQFKSERERAFAKLLKLTNDFFVFLSAEAET